LLRLQLEKLSTLPNAGVFRRAECAGLPQTRERY
jgi:hypothetical protein